MTLPSTYSTTPANPTPTPIQLEKPERADAVSGVDSSTFGEGVRLLPNSIQKDIRQLYYVLRTIDDLVDENHPDAAQRLDAVERWAEDKQPASGEESELLEDLSRRHPLSGSAILEFCEGMRHDLTGGTIRTEDDLERYCQQAGGAVGVLLASILGTVDDTCAHGMAALGRAMQRTNILRDIDEDYANDRIYIAQTTIDRFGFPHPGEREQLLRDQIPRADRLYEQGAYAARLLKHGSQAMSLSTALYREILRQLERDGFGRKPGRATVSQQRKETLVAQHSTHREPLASTLDQAR